jgi:cytidine deaminase
MNFQSNDPKLPMERSATLRAFWLIPRVMKKVASGKNSYREFYSGCKYSRHAETDAIDHLPSNNNNRIITLNLVVIRVNIDGTLKNSKPCAHCLMHLTTLTHARRYRVKYVYYSDNNGSIVRKKLSELMDDDNMYVTRRFRINH